MYINQRHEVLLTAHAQARMQQRGIRAAMVERLLEFGHVRHDHHGSCILHFDKRSRARALRGMGPGQAGILDCCRNIYAVLGSDGRVTTVGHRYRRLRHH